MSTRSTITVSDSIESGRAFDPKTGSHFSERAGARHHIYRHHDGYPQSEHGVIADLQGARALSWQGFDASDYAAALVARMKTGPGSVYLTEDPDRHGDREFHYEVRGAGREIAVAVHSFRFRTEFSLRPVAQVIFEGSLDEAAARFESGPVHSERADMLARVWPALEAAEMALSDFETAPAGRASDSERESPQTKMSAYELWESLPEKAR